MSVSLAKYARELRDAGVPVPEISRRIGTSDDRVRVLLASTVIDCKAPNAPVQQPA
jgi:hypothetical protein